MRKATRTYLWRGHHRQAKQEKKRRAENRGEEKTTRNIRRREIVEALNAQIGPRNLSVITRYTFNLQIEYQLQDRRSTTVHQGLACKLPVPTTAACSDWCEIIWCYGWTFNCKFDCFLWCIKGELTICILNQYETVPLSKFTLKKTRTVNTEPWRVAQAINPFCTCGQWQAGSLEAELGVNTVVRHPCHPCRQTELNKIVDGQF